MLKAFIATQNRIAGFLTRDDKGATAVEYGLIVALVAGVIVAVVTTLGTKIAATFQSVVGALP